ncbi:hypothetical protein SCHPADRAFT_598639 [Schizopora paradoxa]|uniref:Uncharacterized protein n=1 Tax=Schizopora paradoxa TaxID=27342 RepID=A0A0H2RA26_9AGAM|nr:hypothetical protein SCHPADRAFT_598639 [Schizopora paradoxa]
MSLVQGRRSKRREWLYRKGWIRQAKGAAVRFEPVQPTTCRAPFAVLILLVEDFFCTLSSLYVSTRFDDIGVSISSLPPSYFIATGHLASEESQQTSKILSLPFEKEVRVWT